MTGPMVNQSLGVSRGTTAPQAVLRCLNTTLLKAPGGEEITLIRDPVTVGRGSDNHVVLHAHGISRAHARLSHQHDGWLIEDLGSTNGTRVNNSKITKHALRDGDTVAFGRVPYKFLVVSVSTSTGVDIDLGMGDRTLVMRPNDVSGADVKRAGMDLQQPTARQPPSHANTGSSNSSLWAIFVLVAFALLVGAAALLNLF